MSSHQFIPRLQNYSVMTKYVSVHSDDRDFVKFPKASEFEVILPKELQNICSVRMERATIPLTDYAFSKIHDNINLRIGTFNGMGWDDFTITIEEGNYDFDTLVSQLNESLHAVSDPLYKTEDALFIYERKTNKLYLEHSSKQIRIVGNYVFNDSSVCNKFTQRRTLYPTQRQTMWGLPYFLGYERTVCESVPIDGKNRILPTNQLLTTVDTDIYVEIDKLNMVDELDLRKYETDPTKPGTNGSCGRTNSAFVKIPIVLNDQKQINASSKSLYTTVIGNELTGESYYERPIEKLSRFKLRFRYHDGTLVDFSNYPVSLSLAFSYFIDTQARNMTTVNRF